MLESVLIANRGEIASRIIRAARKCGMRTIAVYSDADGALPFVGQADTAIRLGGAPVAESYRNGPAILAAARQSDAAAVHPGYGFLAEDADFAAQVEAAGLCWIGPASAAIAAMGDKLAARNLVAAAGVPVSPGSTEPLRNRAAARAVVDGIGFPVMVKAVAGGGGMGLAAVIDPAQFDAEFARVTGFAGRVFGDDTVLIERYYPRVRHIEVQVFGLADGTILTFGERDCSVQRRHQKLAEETPAPGLPAVARQRLADAARAAAAAVDYQGAGTVEFLLDVETGEFVFCEMNTRLQVEHTITEEVFDIDLVAAQLLAASGTTPDLAGRSADGCAIELRINAEDPVRFLPRPGTIAAWREPMGSGIRVDAGYQAGNTVTPHYDSLLAKLVVTGADRAEAVQRAVAAADAFVIRGVQTNLPFHHDLLANPEFVSGSYDTGIVGRMRS